MFPASEYGYCFGIAKKTNGREKIEKEKGE